LNSSLFASESYFYVEYAKFRAFSFIISIPCCKTQIVNLIKIFYIILYVCQCSEAKSLIRLSCTKQVYGSSSLYYWFFFPFCFQTDGSVPNTLVIANCEVVKPRVAAAEHISQVTHYFVTFLRSPSRALL
jgi:hypothetical protein